MFLTFIWRLPAKIRNLLVSPEPSGQKPARRRPLHTCGSSCLSIARKACTKAQDLEGPLGSRIKTSIALLSLFSPLVRRCLALLLILDDQILWMESKVERVVPRSACLFDGVDKLVRGAEALPEQVDDAVNKTRGMIRQFPLLEWGVGHLIWCVSFLIRFKESSCSKGGGGGGGGDGRGNEVEQTKTVQFEKPYSYVNQTSEMSKAEVTHLSVKRLQSWKTRIKALEEPLSAGDSPMYSSYLSANSSPVSDCSVDENHPFSQQPKDIIGDVDDCCCISNQLID